ncbi:hypothetical protein ECH_0938 [Ehrlichia chaffeensis str. Arkansas]|uniref:Uncharacterized protein n=1 Tax=Ehrlichia chaffeensis (strain ATCC CRL-10679 / Arkansas) TaxID=205920 RepID=Q2GFQ6_EHRCR|nr:hypothetical protein ECH_0938 [Ehrlichia chaffeensis str. Arkansas]AHX07194.1 hypothetical protein ECHOSC_0839 [Ehrlichia chaffeensis str. Osceola]
MNVALVLNYLVRDIRSVLRCGLHVFNIKMNRSSILQNSNLAISSLHVLHFL